MFYKYVFRNLVFRPYKRLNEEEKEIDKIIDNYILIIGSEGEDENDKILIDNNFFKLLFDASRIDELNNFFLMEINNKDPKKCLIQKIIIYNLYNYFNDYLIFDEKTQEEINESFVINNGEKLKKAGLPVTDANLYMMHFFGNTTQTGMVLSANDNDSMKPILDYWHNQGKQKAIPSKENALIASMTVGEYKKYLRKNNLGGWLVHIFLVILSLTNRSKYDNRY